MRSSALFLALILLALVPDLAAAEFPGTVVLGRPTRAAVSANLLAPSALEFYLEYGVQPGSYPARTEAQVLTANQPREITLTGLPADTRHYYRVRFRPPGAATFDAGTEASFMTARAPGSTFTFVVQGDSHPERSRVMFDSALYTRAMQTMAADHPDFFLTLGDDFSVDTINQANPAAVTQPQVVERYTIQRPYLGIIGRSAPVFLVNGNHEQAARYLLDGTPNNVAVWAQNARNLYYAQPATDDFYSGNPEVIPHIGLLRNRFAWTWGDALFVAIDPYWGSPVCVDNSFFGNDKRSDLWDITHGDAQYQWLRTTLEQSKARYKFVFAHHVLGTLRGGIDVAMKYEWGGENGNGTPGFAARRPTWPLPIHQLMAANKVTIFFQGHDHIWVRQQLDGVTYQSLGNPADPNYSLFNSDAYVTGDRFPNSGYARVTVAPAGVTVDYVRTFLPADEGPGRRNGTVAYSYTLASAGTAVPVITQQPAAQTVVAGGTATFSIVATSSLPLAFQWQRNGADLPGATASGLTLPSVQAGDVGTYTVRVSTSAGSATSSPASLTLGSSRLVNLSVRGNAGTGNDTLIVGFVVSPGTPVPVLVRGIGPTLARFGLGGLLADPVLTLTGSGGAAVAANDNWSDGGSPASVTAASSRVGAFALDPGSLDAALVTSLGAGNYGVQIAGKAGTTGLALVEAYDAAPAPGAARLLNVSARGRVTPGSGILIAGFTVSGDAPRKVLIRAVGPTLGTKFALAGSLPDPSLGLFRAGATAPFQQNDNWASSNLAQVAFAAAQVGAFDLPPNSLDAALLLTLEPGSYTAQAGGTGNAAGIALIEVYEVP